jgi:DNA polymerase-3 subunit gamma/tau
MDVVEIDAASNNGVDSIRELRDDVKYMPSKCRYKVYIIDEVHMLSTQAFNALLKTLEEPPAHVVFILATTEFHKVPATIVSRCQRFDFKRIKVNDMVSTLKKIASDGAIEVEDRTLSLIARSSDGAMRDALSLFDQCISLKGNKVVYEDVMSILGITTDGYLFRITDAVAGENAAECISIIDELIINGKDAYQFTRDLTMHFRNLLVAQVGHNALDILNVSEEMFEELRLQSKKFSTESILRNINILSAAESDMKWSSQPRIMLEMAAIRLCRKELGADVDSLLERVARLEEMLSGNNVRVDAVPALKQPEASEEVKPVKSKASAPPAQKKEAPGAVQGVSLQEVSSKWKEILKSISAGGHKILYAFIQEARPVNISGGILTIEFDRGYEIHKSRVEDEGNRRLAEEFISSVLGFKVKLRCVIKDEIAMDAQEDDIVEKAISIFGEELVEVEE